MIRRGYSPPFQARAPQPGGEDAGRAIKGLVSVEVSRSNEMTFAVESFGCDGKPVLSPMRGLSCEADGRLVIAGTKNGMPFRLNGDLPRGVGSAIRGAGGGLVSVAAGAAMLSSEWVIYDNAGNCWSLDRGSSPVYLGTTPPLASGDGVTPALAVQAPEIRPYELRWERIALGGDGGFEESVYSWGGCGWIEDGDGAAVIASPITYPYTVPSSYWRVDQWVPDETTAPAGATHSPHWPTSVRHVEVEWYPARTDQPSDWAAVTDNSLDVLMAQYPGSAPWRYYANQWTRPLLEHISPGGTVAEDMLLMCIERNKMSSSVRIAIRNRGTGALVSSLTIFDARSDDREAFTPYKGEGWLRMPGTFSGTTAVVRHYRSRTTLSDPIGSGLALVGNVTITRPTAAAAWVEPVWFRVGQVRRVFGLSERLTPLLPRWR